MTFLRQNISIHLHDGQRSVAILRSEGSLTVKLGMSTSSDDIRRALQSSVTRIELDKILQIWADDDTLRCFELVGDTTIISEATEPG